MSDDQKNMKKTQDQVQDLTTDLITKESLLAVSVIGIVVIGMWVGAWFLFLSRL